MAKGIFRNSWRILEPYGCFVFSIPGVALPAAQIFCDVAREPVCQVAARSTPASASVPAANRRALSCAGWNINSTRAGWASPTPERRHGRPRLPMSWFLQG